MKFFPFSAIMFGMTMLGFSIGLVLGIYLHDRTGSHIWAYLAVLFMGFSFYLKDSVIPRFKDPIRAALALSRSKPLTPPPYFDRDHGYYVNVHEYSTTRKIGRGVEVSNLHPNGKISTQIDANSME